MTVKEKIAARKEKIAARNASYRAANKEKVAAYKADWHLANKEKIAARHAAHYVTNKEKISAQHADWVKNNPHLIAARDVRRKRSVKQATPVWANSVMLASVYRDAAEFRGSGVHVHVDHIVPLNAKLACGLHNEFNVTVKIATLNDSKGNKFDPMTFDPFDHPAPRHFMESR